MQEIAKVEMIAAKKVSLKYLTSSEKLLHMADGTIVAFVDSGQEDSRPNCKGSI